MSVKSVKNRRLVYLAALLIIASIVLNPDILGIFGPSRTVFQGAFYYLKSSYDYTKIDSDIATMRGWGFNVINLVIFAHQFSPGWGQYDWNYIGKLDYAINSAKTRGMWVILNFHQFLLSPAFTGDTVTAGGLPSWLFAGYGSGEMETAWNDLFYRRTLPNGHDSWRYVGDVWAFLAARYKGRNNIISYDLFNEPHKPSWANNWDFNTRLRDFYEYIIDRIRAVDTETNVMIQGGDGYGGWADNDLQVPRRTNVALDAHVYATRPPWWAWWDNPAWNMVAGYASLAASRNLYVVFTEFGSSYPHSDLDYALRVCDAINSHASSNVRVRGWQYWSYNSNSPYDLERNPWMASQLRNRLSSGRIWYTESSPRWYFG